MDRLKSGKLKQISSSVRFVQRKLTVGGRGGSFTVRLVSSFTSLDLAASLGRYKNMIFSSLVKSSLVKLETSYTVVLPPTVSGLWFGYQSVQWI